MKQYISTVLIYKCCVCWCQRWIISVTAERAGDILTLIQQQPTSAVTSCDDL